ncbi:MAG: bifunctional diaminohydroxyphosphoribosylaminopyrimidine deaminase/5-amino-6-(5-phosphoribosylamino)uracil reductase RibD [Deltaproteobacteria bacterium]|nr:bifunctional diaminohydroxyphosphoribosylaminopyrimidine deaminase/5-amino-6-(5-phosphoribosylamino)uracil reductase RibD [Deltaproteobacteria bacterium]
MQDAEFMEIALGLAERGKGMTSPNPLVGAVVVKGGKVVGKGYHKRAGLPHAEAVALRDAGSRAKGATLYINLEPCDHYGRTPPCTSGIIKAGIKMVVIGMMDPNPLVSGKGIKRLREAGVEVQTSLLRDRCKRLNEVYIKYITTRRPFVTLKMATTLDGRIATASGESKWITGRTSRRYVHRMRGEVDAVMVGVGTVLKDDPLLTTRLVKGKNPHRVVVDKVLRIPLKARVFNPSPGMRLFLATTIKASKTKVKRVMEMGAEVLVLRGEDGGVYLDGLMVELGKRGVTNLLIEGGARLATSAMRSGIVDKVVLFYSPMFLGRDGIPIFNSMGIKGLKDTIKLKDVEVKRVGQDFLVEGYVVK